MQQLAEHFHTGQTCCGRSLACRHRNKVLCGLRGSIARYHCLHASFVKHLRISSEDDLAARILHLVKSREMLPSFASYASFSHRERKCHCTAHLLRHIFRCLIFANIFPASRSCISSRANTSKAFAIRVPHPFPERAYAALNCERIFPDVVLWEGRDCTLRFGASSYS